MPRKRDRYGNRIGFLLAADESEAIKILRARNGKEIGKHKLYLSWARGTTQPTHPAGVTSGPKGVFDAKVHSSPKPFNSIHSKITE